MPKEYSPAKKIEYTRLKKVLKKYHKDKKDIVFTILYISDMEYTAQIRKVPPLYKLFINGPYIILLNQMIWGDLTKKEKIAVLDHELCHVVVDINENSGSIAYKLSKHDIEEYIEVVERHGAVIKGVHKMLMAYKDYKKKKKGE